MSSAEVFETVSDPLYSATTRMAPLAAMTKSKDSFVVSTNQSYGTPADPLNGPNARTLIFEINGSQCRTLKWNECALRLNMHFTKSGVHNAPVPRVIEDFKPNIVPGMLFNSPPPFMVGELIRSVTLWLNGVEVYKSSDDFGAEFFARMIRNYSGETLENMDGTLFTPIWDESYSCALNTAHAAVDPAAGARGRPFVGVGMNMEQMTSLNTTAATALHNMAYNINPNAAGRALKRRAEIWCDGVANSHLRPITKFIHLRDLAPTFPNGIIRNLNSIKLEVRFSNSLDHLICTNSVSAGCTAVAVDTDAAVVAGIRAVGDGAGDASTRMLSGDVRVTRCDLMITNMTPEALQEISLASEKAGNQADIIPLMMTELTKVSYVSGNHILLPAKSNVDTIMLFKKARTTMAVNAAYTRQDSSQTLLFTDAAGRYKADQPGASEFIQRFQMRVDNQPYPANPIEITDNGYTNLAQAYLEYRKAIRRVDRIEGSPSIPYWAYKAAYPFLMLRPWSDAAPHRSPPQALTLIPEGGSNTTDVNVVLFRYVVFKLLADGTVQKFD